MTEPTVERSPAREEALAEVLRPLMTDPKWYEESEVRRWSARIIAALPSVGLALVEVGSEPLTGREVHAAWRDGMLRQGRIVADYRMNWDTLSRVDRDLGEWIAARLTRVGSEPSPEPLTDKVQFIQRVHTEDGGSAWEAVSVDNPAVRVVRTTFGSALDALRAALEDEV